MTIYIICSDCASWNKHNWDNVPLDHLKETEFTTFSDAHKHMIENPDHYMYFEVRDASEDDYD